MKRSQKIKNIILTAILLAVFSYIFKYIPMQLFGQDILFDASRHIMVAVFGLYFVYLFIEHNKEWMPVYFMFSFAVLTVISLQRIVSNAHNDVGLALGLILSAIAIILPRWKEFRGRVRF